ncbi:MAG TPA: hypothetical protein VFT64_10370 [Rickettsiales bacterium]|nr:hypothetical protein [Rickettsiales bacterium]
MHSAHSSLKRDTSASPAMVYLKTPQPVLVPVAGAQPVRRPIPALTREEQEICDKATD